MEITLNLYITLWILFAVIITMIDDSTLPKSKRQIVYWIVVSVFSIMWIESPLSKMNLSLNGMFNSNNGLINLRSYLP